MAWPVDRIVNIHVMPLPTLSPRQPQFFLVPFFFLFQSLKLRTLKDALTITLEHITLYFHQVPTQSIPKSCSPLPINFSLSFFFSRLPSRDGEKHEIIDSVHCKFILPNLTWLLLLLGSPFINLLETHWLVSSIGCLKAFFMFLKLTVWSPLPLALRRWSCFLLYWEVQDYLQSPSTFHSYPIFYFISCFLCSFVLGEETTPPFLGWT